VHPESPDPIEVLLEMLMTRWSFCPFNKEEIHCNISEAYRKKLLHCPGIGRTSGDWVVVLISALYVASAAEYAEKTHLRI